MEQKTSTSMFEGASPKLTFVFGVIAGVAATSLLILGFNFFKAPGTATAKSSTNTSTTNTSTTGAPTYSDVKAVSDSDYIRGDKNAKITLVEYSDYECPFCKSFHPTMQQVMSNYGGKVRWVYRHFPLSFHANAPKEAEAALCVGDQGGADKYWDFTDKIFQRTTSNGTGFALTDLPALAKEVGVNQAKFEDCLNNGKMTARVQAETTDGTNGGASGTPTTFIVGPDGKNISVIPGALPYDQVKTQLDQALTSI